MQAFEDKEFSENFINGKSILPITIDFETGEPVKISFKCWVESELKEGFDWKILKIKLALKGGSLVTITLNHPTSPAGISTIENMIKNAVNYISEYIPKIIIKNESIIRKAKADGLI